MDIMMQVLQRLQEDWAIKLAISCIVSITVQEHAQIFVAFSWLVAADLITKWLSLSRQCLIDHGTESPTFWQALWGIRTARRLGYIRSEEMRSRFAHKILTYIGVVTSSLVLDFLLMSAHLPAFAANLTIGYLATTEFISILENMQRSGVEEADGLVTLVKRRGGLGKKGD